MSTLLEKLVNMSALDAYHQLKNWQGMLGSLFGFIALLGGALFNARLNRTRDDRLRHQEMLTVAAALYGEILLLRKEAARVAKALAFTDIQQNQRTPPITFNSHFVAAHKLPNATLYEALGSKVGLLDSKTALGITQFYQNIREVDFWLPFLVEDKSRNFSDIIRSGAGRYCRQRDTSNSSEFRITAQD